MAALEQASLSDVERRVLERFVRALEEELGDDLDGVWLYGSRARGEPPHEESDVDLPVVSPRAGWDESTAIHRALDAAAEAEGENPWRYSLVVYAPERVANRREIRSFFMQEVDRDKVVLAGAREPALRGVPGAGGRAGAAD